MPYIEKIGRLVHGGGCLQVRASSSSQGQGQWFDFLATTVFFSFIYLILFFRYFFKGLLVVA